MGRIHVRRRAPPSTLAAFFDHCWIIEWRLEDRPPEEQYVLPSPNAHLLICPGETALYGVVRGKHGRLLRGNGLALGLRFRMGGLRPFLHGPVAEMTGKTAPLESLTGKPDHCVEEAVLCQASFEDMMQAAEATLMPRLPMPDPLIDEVCSIVARVRRQGGPRRADALAKRRA